MKNKEQCITNCRICKSDKLEIVISLGEQYITSRFPIYGDFTTPKTNIDLIFCKDCNLLQLYQIIESKELYEHEYGYCSGISNTMRQHLKIYQEEICSYVTFNDGDVVLDIGSNDSTMLQLYSNKLKRIGCDPTGNQFKHLYGDIELIVNYFNYENFTNKYGDTKCKIVSSISMFYDLPDPVQFAKDIYNILDIDGIWTCEQSYVLEMINTNSIDTICHEHLEYYSLKQIKYIADCANFKIIDVKFNDCNGGSFRIYFAKKESNLYNENIELINKILKNEIENELDNVNTYHKFMDNCNSEIKKLSDFIHIINENGQKIYVYGASTKGNCLLQYANLNEQHLQYAVERNLNKVGKMTSTGIEIISEETMRNNPPNFLLVLPWHFKNEIINREKKFLDNGGQLVFPFPKFEIITTKQKVLITGCDGMISQYVKYEYANECMYGFGHFNPTYESKILKKYFDMNDKILLEYLLSIIKPNIIIHLASISSSKYALDNPIETLNINGMVTAYLCDIIYRNKWNIKLFNASSSEIYKGHIVYDIKEDDTNTYHLHPYSISKIMGKTIVDFYRETYNMKFSNGIIFTTESHLKSSAFLLKKIANHIQEIKKGNLNTLIVGNLDSYRNIIHASDVANAIRSILLLDHGDNYNISNDHMINIKTLVFNLCELAGISLYENNNSFYMKNILIDKPIVTIDNNIGNEKQTIYISGKSNKLYKLGWKPKFDVYDILNEYLQTPIIYVGGGFLGDFIQQLSVIKEKFIITGRKGILYIGPLFAGDNFSYGLENIYNDTYEIISSQEYILDYKIYNGEKIDINLSSWRENDIYKSFNWYFVFKYNYNINWGQNTWINLEKNEKWKNKIFINATSTRPIVNIDASYYEKLIEKYGDDVQFLAFNEDDYIFFKNLLQIELPLFKPISFTEMCIAINSCKLFIGGLSMPLTIAHATHKLRVIGLGENKDDALVNTGLDLFLPNIIESDKII